MWLVVISMMIAAVHAKASDSFRMDYYNELEDDFFAIINSRIGENYRKSGLDAKHDVNGVEVASGCSIFIDARSRLGAQGAYAVNEVMSHPENYRSILSANGLNEQCPNWPNLETPDKAQVIALLLTVMAHFESRCQPTVPNRNAPNGVARGLFQLHEGREQDYDGTTNACERNSSMDANQSIDCALAMLNIQFSRSGILFDRRSYWDVLRPQGEAQTTGVIGGALARSRLCKIGG